MNVRHSLILLTPLLISGCSILPSWKTSSVDPITIKTQAVERTPLNLKDPDPLKAREIQWVVITPDNAEAVWKKLKESNTDLVLIGLTDDGYQELALTMAELRNLIATQRSIIIKYKEYYEPPKAAPSK